jgi:hypothetical protein
VLTERSLQGEYSDSRRRAHATQSRFLLQKLSRG